MILLGISVASFFGLRSTIALNEGVLNMQQNFRYAQRSALLLKVDEDENWPYGIGIDMSTIREDNTYRVFKWCSSFLRYGDSPTTEGKFPGASPTNPYLGAEEGVIPFNKAINGKCETTAVNGAQTIGELNGVYADITQAGDGVLSDAFIDDSFEIGIKLSLLDNDYPNYIVYRSLNGVPFFYDSNGDLMNHNYSSLPDEDDITRLTPITHFEMIITDQRRSRARLIYVSQDSGKMISENVEDVSTVNFNEYTFAP